MSILTALAAGGTAARVSTTIISGPPAGTACLILRRRAGEGGETGEAGLCEIVIGTEAEPDLAVIGPFGEDDAIAIWRDVAARGGYLPGLQAEDGALHWPFDQIGRLQLGGARPRRRARSVGTRRPRFLVRRKAGCMPRRPLVYRESEIAGGRGA